MNNTSVDMEAKSYAEVLTLESLLKQLWEKVRLAAERISRLKEESESYRSQVEQLEHEVNKLRSEIGQKEQEVKRLKQDHSQLANTLNNNNILSAEVQESLKIRIKELIVKINSHL